uniref:SfiI-subtelomeric related protein family member, putative n=1 Tax=Theileria annulata TaxID=5874 RepID=A0A3B0MGV2_THEAN
MLEEKLEYKAELVDGKPVLCCKFGNDKDWNNITNLRYDVEKLTFNSLDNKKFTFSNCSNGLKDLTFAIMFSCVCSEVIYKDQILWSYWVNPFCGYPIKLLFNLKSNTLALSFKQNKLIPLNINCYNTTNSDISGKSINSVNTVNDMIDGIFEIENGFVEMIDKDGCVNTVETSLGLAWRREPEEPFPVSVIYQGNNRVVLVSRNQFTTCTFNGVQWSRNTTKTL